MHSASLSIDEVASVDSAYSLKSKYTGSSVQPLPLVSGSPVDIGSLGLRWQRPWLHLPPSPHSLSPAQGLQTPAMHDCPDGQAESSAQGGRASQRPLLQVSFSLQSASPRHCWQFPFTQNSFS